MRNPNVTLAQYIGSRAEFDRITIKEMYRVLLKRGWITRETTGAELEAARKEAREVWQPSLD